MSGCRNSSSDYFFTPGSSSDSSLGDGSDQGSGDSSKKTSPCETKSSGQISDPLTYYTYQIDQSTDIKLIEIPAGYFWMWSKESEGEDNERPRHCVRITKAFYLSETEVTKKQWGAVMGDTVHSGYNAPACTLGTPCTWE